MGTPATGQRVKRQSRWAVGESHAVVLQPRDLDFFQFIFELGYVSAKLLHDYVCPEVEQRIVARRLKQLHDKPNCYLSRPDQQRDNHQANYSHLIYAVTDKAVDALLNAGRITQQDVLWRQRLFTTKYREFWHDVNCANVIGSLRLAIKDAPSLRFVTPFDILRKAPTETQASTNPFTFDLLPKGSRKRRIIPDYIFGIAYARPGQKDGHRFFWYEHDQATEPVQRVASQGSSFIEKLLDCDEMLEKGLYRHQLGLPDIYVTTVTLTVRHLQSIQAHSGRLRNKTRFLFKALNTFSEFDKVPKPSPLILKEPWAMAGSPPLRIDQS